MGWSFRKSLRLLPGIRINLSKSGPRLSVGVPGVRASIGVDGKARVYGSAGPIRYQKATTLGSERQPHERNNGLVGFIRRILTRE